MTGGTIIANIALNWSSFIQISLPQTSNILRLYPQLHYSHGIISFRYTSTRIELKKITTFHGFIFIMPQNQLNINVKRGKVIPLSLATISNIFYFTPSAIAACAAVG
jgi:hypothetical protein